MFALFSICGPHQLGFWDKLSLLSHPPSGRPYKIAQYSYHKNPAQESRTKPDDHFYAKVAETVNEIN